MAKRVNKAKAGQAAKPKVPAEKEIINNDTENQYLWSMSYAPRIDQGLHWMHLVPIIFFSAIIVMITRMASYSRPMEQFLWTNSGNDLTDFFSYYKMIFILICGALALVFLAYRLCTQSLAIKRSAMYIPMAVYAVCVLLSYAFSDYKEFSLLGWNDRFEGTLVLLAYMVMLFYIINTINTAKAVKAVLYAITASSSILGILGITQALDHDFFRTTLGQKLIVPNSPLESGGTAWDMIDAAAEQGQQFLSFTFQNKEIYQTVYNINYVSFYLTLLLPVVGLLFILSVVRLSKMRKEDSGEKHPSIIPCIVWGLLFALLLYNFIGSASSGGFLGMFVVVVLAIILINKKIIKWIKPLAMLIVITLIVGGITFDRWSGEIFYAFTGALGNTSQETQEPAANENGEAIVDAHKHVDSIKVDNYDITVSYDGDAVTFTTNPDDVIALIVKDADGKNLPLAETTVSPIYQVDDERFKYITIRPAEDENGNSYVVIGTGGDEWPFLISDDGVKYLNGVGNISDIESAPAIGWATNPEFGSGRGYIWSRTIPMMEKTLILGHGADTYCIYFPQNDYVGKYNSGTFSSNINIIVDKPHNMYMGMWIGTGGISVIAFLAMLVIYIIQTIRIYWRKRYETFLDFAGIGIFLGIMGFAVTGLVDDSTVSVMPMFYGLLGTGIASNIIQARNMPKKAKASKPETVSEEK